MLEMVGGSYAGVVGNGLYGHLTLPGGIRIYLNGEVLEIARKAKLEAVMTTEGVLCITASDRVRLAVNDGVLEVSTKNMANTVTVKVSPSLEGVHDPTKAYDRLSVVYDETTQVSYISRDDVPAGTALSNANYWQPYTSVQAQPHIIDSVTGAAYTIQIANGDVLAKQMT